MALPGTSRYTRCCLYCYSAMPMQETARQSSGCLRHCCRSKELKPAELFADADGDFSALCQSCVDVRSTPAHVAHSALWQAQVRGIPVHISEKELTQVLEDAGGTCTYCATAQSYLGLDRVAAGVASPYAPGNVVACCTDCNALKGCMDLVSWSHHVLLLSAALEASSVELEALMTSEAASGPVWRKRYGDLNKIRRQMFQDGHAAAEERHDAATHARPAGSDGGCSVNCSADWVTACALRRRANILYSSTVRGARARCIGVSVGVQDVQAVLTQSAGYCFYCRRYEGLSLGLDRVAAGPHSTYSKGNLVACCWECNRMKGAWDLGTFVSKVHTLATGIRLGA